MSSLKSLSAAKSRRGNDQQHVVSGTRPGTSIASHGAFVPQYSQPTRGQNPPPNLRQAGIPPGQPQYPQNMYNQQQEIQIQPNGLPFTKLTVSDAIGLITLRLGKVEQFLIDLENGETTVNKSDATVHDNFKLIDNSVLTNMVSRLDSLEKKELTAPTSNNQNNENYLKLEKELKETKEILMNLMFKFELFTKETNNRLDEHHNAILVLENNMQNSESILINEDDININLSTDAEADAEKILSAELKTIIKQELSNSEM
jgi:hypothetical protein